MRTRTIEKMLDEAAAGSAEQKALQEELRRRDLDSHLPDKRTGILFDKTTWGGIRQR